MTKPPPFFTWILTDINSPDDVTPRMRAYMRMLWLNGEKVQTIADTFQMPVDWIEDFVREPENRIIN